VYASISVVAVMQIWWWRPIPGARHIDLAATMGHHVVQATTTVATTVSVASRVGFFFLKKKKKL
jgi:hypothetical protein